jgi:hypothetical protein
MDFMLFSLFADYGIGSAEYSQESIRVYNFLCLIRRVKKTIEYSSILALA